MIRTAFWCACLGLAVVTLLPGEYLPPVAQSIWDKAEHAVAFMCLGLLGLWAYPSAAHRVAIGLLAYGAAIELAQAATGWRTGDWRDWLADAVGVLAAYAVWRILRHRN